jgi:hypothetical protein
MIQTSTEKNAVGKNVKPMADDEVRARLERIAGYNRAFAGTHHAVTEREIYGYMVNEWHVEPSVYDISAAPAVKNGQRIPWLPGGERPAAQVKRKGAARDL